MAEHQVVYGGKTIPFALAFKPRRTLAIEVFPDQSVQVTAPTGTSAEEIKRRVKRRAAWVLRQQRSFASLVAPQQPKDYVSGESFRYLGRQYRLKIIEAECGEKEEVKLSGGYIRVFTFARQDSARIKSLVDTWYRTRARTKLRERFQRCCEKIQRYGVLPPYMEVRRMTRRWGSCTPSRRILLNDQLVQAPTYCIDYVIFHELCHLKFNNHKGDFFRLLRSVFPQWELAKKRLERIQEF